MTMSGTYLLMQKKTLKFTFLIKYLYTNLIEIKVVASRPMVTAIDNIDNTCAAYEALSAMSKI